MSVTSRARWCLRALPRTAIVAGATTAGLLLFTVPALAHITITPSSAQPGSAAVLTFHVPNEEAKADTTRVDVQIPTDHPIAQLLVEPIPGWTISVRTITLAKPLVTDDGSFSQAVSEVIWSGGQIPPGQFQDFSISADPLPQKVSQLTFKAIQTYSNGDVVRWIDVSQPGQPEPDHPAPVLTLSAGTAAAPPAADGSAAATSSSGGSDGMARGIAVGGVVIGLLGLSLAGLSWRRGKAVVMMEPLAPTPNGLAMATAAQPAPEARNDTQARNATGPRNGTQSRRAGTPARETPTRKSASSGRRRTHR